MSKLLIGVTVGGLAIYGLNTGIDGIKQTFNNVLDTPVIENVEETDFKQIIVSELSSHSKLSTTSTIVRPSIETTVDREILGIVNIGSLRIKIHGYATVNTGIDLSKVQPGDLVVEGDRVTINAPAIEILSIELDPGKSDITIITEGVPNFSRQYQADIIQSTQSHLIDAARNSVCGGDVDIVLHTENSVREALENLIKPIGFVEVNVNFEDPC